MKKNKALTVPRGAPQWLGVTDYRPSSKGFTLKRSDFLNGLIFTDHGPGQMFGGNPTDWPAAGTLLRVPKVVYLNMDSSNGNDLLVAPQIHSLFHPSHPEFFAIDTSFSPHSIRWFESFLPLVSESDYFGCNSLNIVILDQAFGVPTPYSINPAAYPNDSFWITTYRTWQNLNTDPFAPPRMGWGPWAPTIDPPPFPLPTDHNTYLVTLAVPFDVTDYESDGTTPIRETKGFHYFVKEDIYTALAPLVEAAKTETLGALDNYPNFGTLVYVDTSLMALLSRPNLTPIHWDVNEYVDVVSAQCSDLAELGFIFCGDVDSDSVTADDLAPRIRTFFGFSE